MNVYVSSDMTYRQYKEKFIKKEVEIDRNKKYNEDTKISGTLNNVNDSKYIKRSIHSVTILRKC